MEMFQKNLPLAGWDLPKRCEKWNHAFSRELNPAGYVIP
jgi:hypothetical protein